MPPITIQKSMGVSDDVQEELRKELCERAVNIMNLFSEWDQNGDNQVSKVEFRKAIAESFGDKYARPHVDAVFESFDGDGSGFIDFKELNRGLTKGSKPKRPSMAAAPAATPLKPAALKSVQVEEGAKGGAGEGSDEGRSPGMLRKRPSAPVVSAEEMLQLKLREALSVNSTRVVDLFREWDENGDGKVRTRGRELATQAIDPISPHPHPVPPTADYTRRV
jgi:Ca2+-binding EF-hand superfamily protein